MNWQDPKYWNRELGVFDYDSWFRDGGSNDDLPETLQSNEDNPQRTGTTGGVVGSTGGTTGGFDDPGGAGWMLDWIGGGEERWLDYTSGLKEALSGYASGVDVATESAIARGAEVAEQRAMGGMGAAGNYFSGMRPAIRGAIQSAATGTMAESRSRTKGRGEERLERLGATYADVVGRGFGAGASVYGSLYGSRGGPFADQWRSLAPWDLNPDYAGPSPWGRQGQPVPGQGTEENQGYSR
jgi:hypothetical protein